MAEIKWIKITTDIFDDEKMVLIDSLPKADSIMIIWFKLLALAGKQNNGGVFMLSDKLAYTDEMLATLFRRSAAQVKSALKVFEEFGMIERCKGAVMISNWEKHQNLEGIDQARDRARKRTAKYREKQRRYSDDFTDCGADGDGDCDAYVTDDVTLHERDSDVTVTLHERDGNADSDCDGDVTAALRNADGDCDSDVTVTLRHGDRIRRRIRDKEKEKEKESGGGSPLRVTRVRDGNRDGDVTAALRNADGDGDGDVTHDVTPCGNDGGSNDAGGIGAGSIGGLVEEFNAVCVSYPRVTVLSESRRAALSRLTEVLSREDLSRLFKSAERSEFLKGKNKRGWKATFDWIIDPTNAAKIIDGNFDDAPGGGISSVGFDPDAFFAKAVERTRAGVCG